MTFSLSQKYWLVVYSFDDTDSVASTDWQLLAKIFTDSSLVPVVGKI